MNQPKYLIPDRKRIPHGMMNFAAILSDAESLHRHADTDTVKRGIGSTLLHKIVVVYKGMEMRVCEEV